MNKPTSIPSTYAAGIIQSKAYRALSGFMNRQLEAYGLSLPQWKVLGLLYENRQLTPSQIGLELGVRRPVVTRLINDMESKKLLIKTAGRPDKRQVDIKISSAGRKLAGRLEVSLRRELRRFLGDISHDDLAVYSSVLDKLAAKL